MNEPAAVPTQDETFIVTKEYKRFMEFCDACLRERYIGLCYGPPGVGKTLSARHYAQWSLFETAYVKRAQQPPLAPEAVAAISACRTVCYTPPVANSPNLLKKEISKVCCDFDMRVEEALSCGTTSAPTTDLPTYCQLLIVDEADRLRMPGLEQLRDLYDRGSMGLVLIGMPGLEKRLARYPQFFSRVGFAHRYQGLSEAEIHFLLAHHWAKLGMAWSQEDFADTEALTAIIRITSGNFRLLNRLLAQIQRVLQINHLSAVTKEVVEAARECLVIGVV
jgi:DNA transposition AAA+ family ATPase